CSSASPASSAAFSLVINRRGRRGRGGTGLYLRRPAVSADQFHEDTSLVVFANDSLFSLYYSHQSLVFFVTYWNDQPPSNRKLRDQRFRHFRAPSGDEYRVVRPVVAPADGPVEPLHGCVHAAQLPDVLLSGSSKIADTFD